VALGCAFDATGELHYLTAAQRALWAEDKLFDGSRPATSWCNGAPGIALARMSLMQIAPETFADRQFELQQALYTTAVAPVGPAGDLCCGLAGRLSVLRLAGWTTAALATEEERRSAGMRPGLWTDELPYPAPDPCLFKGVAGILMAQIQAQAPSGVPPVLLPSLDWSRQPPDDTRNP
jgi:lantibiotic modifying enzyme